MNNLIDPITEDQLKFSLINHGPFPVHVNALIFPPTSHIMELVGYNTVKVGDKLFIPGVNGLDSILILPNNSLIGRTYWTFKNSSPLVYLQQPKFFDFCGSVDYFIPSTSAYITGTVTSSTQQLSPLCKDEDEDGYYWWGIGPLTPSCGCPPGVIATKEDCDDSNKGVGSYNTVSNNGIPLYECMDNCPDNTFIPTNLTINQTCQLESMLPAGEESFRQTIVIQPINISNPIVVSVGTSILSTIIRMHPRTFIMVYPGATLKINSDSKITSSCYKPWKGIRIFGSNLPQTTPNQGKVEIVHGIIESAVCAIKDTSLQGSNGESGGIISATLASFKDNHTAIQLIKYSQKISLSKFQRCQFTSVDILPDGSTPLQFVKLDDLNDNITNSCIKFEGCTFAAAGSNRNICGIRSNNSEFSCDLYTYGSTTYATKFEHTQYGVYATSSQMPGPYFTINQCEFDDNFRGVYASGVTLAHILSSTFDVPIINGSWITCVGADNFTSYGIFLEGCAGYHIEANTLTGHWAYRSLPVQTVPRSCGIYVKNSQPPYSNSIYNNTCNSFNTAIASFGKNRDGVANGQGLEIKCNTFSGNSTDIGAYTGGIYPVPPTFGIKYQQGIPNATSYDPTISAGNIFSDDNSGHTYDLYNGNNNSFYYNFHYYIPTNPKLKPTSFTISTVNISENYHSLWGSNSCPAHLNLLLWNNVSFLQNTLATAKTKMDSLSNLLSILTDGGKTDSVNTAILFSMPSDAWELYQDLMSKSPYLSDTVLKSSILKDAVLINAMIRDILVANPQAAKSDSILQLLEDRFIPLSDSMMEEILEGRNFLGAKELLEISRSKWNQIYAETFYDLLYIYQTDTTQSGLQDSITSLFQRDFRYESKYSLAFTLLNQGNIQEADEIIENIPSNYSLGNCEVQEYQKYYCLYNCIKRAVQNDTNLTFDSIQIKVLDSLIAVDTGYLFTPTVFARNILQAAGLIKYCECVVIDPALKSAVVTPENKKCFLKELSHLKIYPNPANDYIVADYKID
ncbi:MAG: hypothetical protein M0P47_13240, partial [Bacteroidales bacterium]|nr:hypothetical protein [Bacteroidales bacterium]